MRKFVWLPLIRLGTQTEAHVLEIMTEATHFGGINMDTLNRSGFAENTAATLSILQELSCQPPNANLYVTSFLPNLSQSQTLTLALLLGCFIQAPSCPYSKVIVTGHIDLAQTHYAIENVGQFDAKLQLLLTLGKQLEPTPFYFPDAMTESQASPKLAQLAANNIMPKPVNRLADILQDFGIDHSRT